MHSCEGTGVRWALVPNMESGSYRLFPSEFRSSDDELVKDHDLPINGIIGILAVDVQEGTNKNVYVMAISPRGVPVWYHVSSNEKQYFKKCNLESRCGKTGT